jgi:predicted RNA binding protein YcfA (HicA-like mRNA interferase family)
MVRERPVTAREFKAVLYRSGFAPRPRKATSHEQWVKVQSGVLYKVAVDAHHAPYHRELLRNMLRQAGMSKRQFFKLLDAC